MGQEEISDGIGQYREMLVRAFFQHAELEGNPIAHIRFRSAVSISNYHAAWLTTAQGDEVVLRFPPSWNPAILTRPHDYLGWVFVSQEGDEVRASLIGSQQRVQEVLQHKKNATEMAIWLETNGYQQRLCTSVTPDVYGLYVMKDG